MALRDVVGQGYPLPGVLPFPHHRRHMVVGPAPTLGVARRRNHTKTKSLGLVGMVGASILAAASWIICRSLFRGRPPWGRGAGFAGTSQSARSQMALC